MENRDHTLRFGSLELDLNSRELCKGATRIRLQEQPFEILRTMLERPGDVVTRQELRKRLWPEGTFVDFEHSLNAAVKRLRAALGDDADNPRFVETLPRRGYRFISIVGAQQPRRPKEKTVPRVRLAVLPFWSLSDTEGQEYFTDGLTEELISQLERMYRGRIGIIARRSSMTSQRATQRALEIGQSLSADYLLEGSVRRDGDRVRITAGLIETSGETHRWSDTYEEHLTDSLSVQTAIAARIAQSLAVELAPESTARNARHGDTDPRCRHNGRMTTAIDEVKGGINQLTRVLALELAGRGIRVNAVAPGYLENVMLDVDPEHSGAVEAATKEAHIRASTPLGRRARLDELIGPVVFLASDASSYITGTVLFVDGGWTAA